MPARKRNGVKESISVVIPAFNESLTIESVAKEALGELKNITDNYELVLVDDGSRDGTGEIIDRLVEGDKHIRAVHHKENRGFTGAMKTAFSSARKQMIFLAPADDQFDFKQLKKIVKAIKGFDVVIAYKTKDDIPPLVKLKSQIFHLPFLFICQHFLGVRVREFSSVSLWRRKVVRSISVEAPDRSVLFLPEMISRAMKCGYKFTEVPIFWKRRRAGEAKGMSLLAALNSSIAIIKLWYRLQKV